MAVRRPKTGWFYVIVQSLVYIGLAYTMIFGARNISGTAISEFLSVFFYFLIVFTYVAHIHVVLAIVLFFLLKGNLRFGVIKPVHFVLLLITCAFYLSGMIDAVMEKELLGFSGIYFTILFAGVSAILIWILVLLGKGKAIITSRDLASNVDVTNIKTNDIASQ